LRRVDRSYAIGVHTLGLACINIHLLGFFIVLIVINSIFVKITQAIEQLESYVFDLQHGLMNGEYKNIEPRRLLAHLYENIQEVRREQLHLMAELAEARLEAAQISTNRASWIHSNDNFKDAS
jgi:hypothetical protein